MFDDLNDIETIIKYLQSKETLLSYYLKEIKKRGYSKREYYCLVEQIDFIKNMLYKLGFNKLKNLIKTCSNQRLKKIIIGEDLIADIIYCPYDYKLFPDLISLDNKNVNDSLIFLGINKKYCIIQHKDKCKDNEGLKYIAGKWQSL